MATQLTLKLLVDRSSQKVLFAEAGKEVVDFLLGLLTLPLGTVIKLLSEKRGDEHHMQRSIANLYKSLNALDDVYFQSSESKSGLLFATHPFSVLPCGFLLPAAAPPAGKKLFRCSNNYCQNVLLTDVYGVPCQNCSRGMTQEMTYVVAAGGQAEKTAGGATSAGYMKSMVTYTVTDDLLVSPMSSISSITLLNKLNVKDVGSLEEKTAVLGPDEALQLLKVSFQSQSVLTDVFLPAKNLRSSGTQKSPGTPACDDDDSA